KEHHAQKAQNKEDLVQKVVTSGEVVDFQNLAKSIFVHEDILKYITEVIVHTRTNPNLTLGASPRASIAILEASKAFAALQGRDFVTQVRVMYVAPGILVHRVHLSPAEEMQVFSTDYIIREIVEGVEVPR